MKLSIVSTLYCSENSIKEFYDRVTDEAKLLVDQSYEIILVNDGSPDKSFEIAVEISNHDSHVKIINLSRNFGHYKAIMTGLKYASGEKIFLLDSDLEEQPEYLSSFEKKMNEENCDVVFGIQTKRKGRLFEKITGELFWRMFNFFSDIDLPVNTVTARLMTKRYVHALLLHQEKEIFIEHFNAHPVTQEIEGGPDANNISGTLIGYGNLFSFIGFSENESPIHPVRNILRTMTRIKNIRKAAGNRIKLNINILVIVIYVIIIII